jgi:hypothetical protein
MVSFMRWPFFIEGKKHVLGGPQRQSGCFREDKNFLSLPELKDHPSDVQPVA